MLRPSSLERSRIARTSLPRDCSSGSCLEYLLMEINLVDDVVTTYFYHDDDAVMLDERPLHDALAAIVDAFRRSPLRVTVHDQDGQILEDVTSPSSITSHLLFMTL